MRRFALIALLSALSGPAEAAKPVTVDQLERVLASTQSRSDKRAAQILSNLVLTERLSALDFNHWQPMLPGPEARRELVILADQAEFLPPPFGELPAQAPPNLNRQRQMLAATVEYAAREVRELPNFLATRETIHFEDTPQRTRDLSRDPAGTIIPYEPLHAVNQSTAHVLFRDGTEVVETAAAQDPNAAKPHGLTTWGEFGPILTTVLVDAANGNLAWRRWERSADGLVAVFRFAVSQEKSHYRVNFCCTPDGGNGSHEFSSYHGELAIDPANGTIRRLSIQADLKPSDPMKRADLLVEYGPVEIGGKEYTCPQKSVSISIAPTSSTGAPAIRTQGRGPVQVIGGRNDFIQTMLNDVAFDRYQVFRTEMRLLTASGDSSSSPIPASTSAGSGSSLAVPLGPVIDPAPAEPSSSQAELKSSETVAPPLTPEQEDRSQQTPEIAETGAAQVPDSSLNQLADKGFSLRVTTRLVDVGIVAADKHGNPITDLKQGDLEIYDDGKRQVVRSFSPALVATVDQPIGKEMAAAVSTNQLDVFSNNSGDMEQSKVAEPGESAHRTIVLIDTSSLAWSDLAVARDRIFKFLPQLAANQQVGLYVQTGRRFQVLVESTMDHAKVAEAIRAWMPNAQQLAQSQEEEARNRQQFDEVLHREDLSQVNGTMNTPGQTQFMQDPELRDFGSNPTRDALIAFVGIARHLAGMAGRTNLVWLASENVLVNWSDATVGSGKGSDARDGARLRAQEVLNDAHISLYPVDASQLETSDANASLANSSVDLSPSVPRGPGDGQHQGGLAGSGLGRESATMQQDVHSIEAEVTHLAEATGGHVFRRGSDLTSTLASLVRDGDASYQLSFAPLEPPDDRYHSLTVKVPSRRNAALRYRTGYLYSKEPALLADRFREAIWQPLDTREIALSARSVSSFNGGALKLSIAFDDLALKLENNRWIGKVDIFVLRRAADEMHARITGRTLALSIQPQTYQTMHGRQIPVDQLIEKDAETSSFRILAVDENSGHMGSITIPAAALGQQN